MSNDSRHVRQPQDPFATVYDTVVIGSGYAAYAATLAAVGAGDTALLVAPRGDLVWESGRGHDRSVGVVDDPGWTELISAVAQMGGATASWLDGALTEVAATDLLLGSGASALYYSSPVVAETGDDELLAAVVVATRSGLRRVVGRRWIDGTEEGTLVRLLDRSATRRRPGSAHAQLFLQHPAWTEADPEGWLPGTAWPTERMLTVEVDPADPAWRERFLVALAELETRLGESIGDVSVSHLSIEPVPEYEGSTFDVSLPGNVRVASPAFAGEIVTSLADRYRLGLVAHGESRGGQEARGVARMIDRPIAPVVADRTLRADVAVVGLGTGGAVSALAAARAGARVVGVEPLAFVGGIGTGGGIHSYWFGTAGGLQQEVDARTRRLMRSFRKGPFGDGPFNPWAKMIALEQLLREESVDILTGAMVFDVERSGDRVIAALVAGPDGVVRIEAESFVDGTGDGDLCALAGADFEFGREGDGLLHAFSQSSGRLRDLHGRPRMQVVNFDAGFCDPDDPMDITRARMSGIRQYLAQHYENLSRPTYIAPALGLRQSRQIATEYVLTLDDQLMRRTFPDAIGFTGSHYDSHGTDYEFESDEAVFWVWANRQVMRPVGCETTYRMLRPRGLANVWIGSRCVGVTQDAHRITRMQRDMQRIGEAAGAAAALAATLHTTESDVVYPALRERLAMSGAFDQRPRYLKTEFGQLPLGENGITSLILDLDPSSTERTVEDALAALDRGEPGEAMWWLYRHPEVAFDGVVARLEVQAKPMVNWLAACLVAMWESPLAEPRLIQTIEDREVGDASEGSEPLEGVRLVPDWLCALALLRRCGTAASLAPIGRLLAHVPHSANTLTSSALTIERLVRRHQIDADERQKALELLDRILGIPTIGDFDYSARDVGQHSEAAIRGIESPDYARRYGYTPPFDEQLRSAYQSNRWQVVFAVSKALASLGAPLPRAAGIFLDDERALVRRAFRLLASNASSSGSVDRATKAQRCGGYSEPHVPANETFHFTKSVVNANTGTDPFGQTSDMGVTKRE